MCGVNSTFIGLILKLHIDFSEDISLVPLQGETSSKEEEQLWLGEKKIWISGTENIKENGETFVLDSFLKENRESLVLDDPPIEENKIELNSQRPERPTHFFFEKEYSRRKEDIIVMPPNTSLNDTTMPSDESSRIDTEVCTYSPESPKIPNPNSNIDQNRRYPLRERKAPDRFGFSKASNVVYPISDFISYHRFLRLP